MSGTTAHEHGVFEDLKAILTGLGHARSALADGDLAAMNELCRRLEDLAGRLGAAGEEGQERLRPLMLALLDEVERTIDAFASEHRDLRDQLRSAARNMAADAAYRKAGTR